jgi:serine/threonine protein phosphatase PrpC
VDKSGVVVADAEREVRDGVVLAGGKASVHSSRSPARESNEDAIALLATGPSSGVIVLADGAGGMPSGGQAARAAIHEIGIAVAGASGDDEGLRSAILDGIEAANAAILEMRSGAATTLEVIEIRDGCIRSYHIGDSETLSWVAAAR